MRHVTRPELVTLPEVFTPARASRFWVAVFECAPQSAFPVEQALTVHLRILAEELKVRPQDTTKFGYLVGHLIAERRMNGHYAGEVRNDWLDMRMAPVSYFREFVASLEGKLFEKEAWRTLVVLYHAGIGARFGGVCNQTWAEYRSEFMCMSRWTDDLDLIKTYREAPRLLKFWPSALVEKCVTAGVPGPFAQRCWEETEMKGEQVVEAWRSGLPFEYIHAIQEVAA